MNQILFVKRNLTKYKIQLVLSLFLFIVLFLYWLYSYFYKMQEENISKSILNSFNITKIYSSVENYTVVQLNNNTATSVIGIIEIPKINIKYPILSDISDDLLKISPCRFYGPYPNQNGNLCIAAHNYDDNRFFGHLYKLDIGDTINIYDINNILTSYVIYNKFESSKNDTSCISENTDFKKEITLITCNNTNKTRLIIKAKSTK